MNAPVVPLSRLQPTAAPASPDSACIAYVMKGFPRLSETFIANEIYLLEQMGLRLRLFSIKREDEPKVHPVVRAIRAPLQYLPKATSLSGSFLPSWLLRNFPNFAAAHLRVASRHPLRYLSVLGSALAMSWRYRRGPTTLRKVFVKEFLQAGHIAAEVMKDGSVAHLHGHFCHGVTTITWFASRLTGLPFSFTAHAKDIYQAELNPGDLLERKLGAATFVATCTSANAEVLKSRSPDVHVVHTIYHGLDTEYFAPAKGNGRDMPMILSVGRFVEKKGFEHLVDACQILKRAGLRFGCLIVGEPGDAYDAVREQIDRLDLGDCIRLRSAVTQDQLREIYRQARTFALPCQVMEDGDRDGIPNVLAEAMAMGLPVVSTPISGIPELIDDGEHGLLVAPRNPAALADALRRILTDDALHQRLSANGRARICARFDSRRTTLALRDLFVRQLQREEVIA
ncbi:MAG: glycosyltransferase family 4 protein [Rhodocyclaceae bacterium]|nr:glycosyltransferase family 4 protein [Rhodocyclaceae bacterium]